MQKKKEGLKIFNLSKKLWPYNRSITGEGNRKTLKDLKRVVNNLKIKSFNSGDKAFDWVVPPEWKINDAFIKASNGKKIIDFKKNNLSIVGYSKPINKVVKLKQIKNKIYYLKNKPDAIPYITSYYKKDWGFCLSYNKYKNINKNEKFHVKIDSGFKKNGKMNYGELLIKGKSESEIFISTYICHPSMANNELSGPCLSIYLADFLSKLKLNYSYRFIFIPETIGSIAYLSKNLQKLKKNVIAGFNITCVGGKDKISFLPTKYGDKPIDKIVYSILKKKKIKFKICNWLQRGSDERQYQSPFIDIPVVSIMKSKYHEYDEYHTSLDNLNFISPSNLQLSFNIYKNIIIDIEKKKFPKSLIICEPNLGKRNLYPKLSSTNINKSKSKLILNFLTYCDGLNSLDDIKNKINCSTKEIYNLYKFLISKKIIK